jgi:7-cyano-7-deazaguanine synthase in queuosine biosynthesis
MKDSVIIVSGGMDSITLLYDKKDEIEEANLSALNLI